MKHVHFQKNKLYTMVSNFLNILKQKVLFKFLTEVFKSSKISEVSSPASLRITQDSIIFIISTLERYHRDEILTEHPVFCTHSHIIRTFAHIPIMYIF